MGWNYLPIPKLKRWMNEAILSHALLGMWLLIHVGIRANSLHVSKRGPMSQCAYIVSCWKRDQKFIGELVALGFWRSRGWLEAFLRWWPPSNMWVESVYGHHRGCLNNPIFSNLGLCAVCWAHFMRHHELWPTLMGHPFPFLSRRKHYQQII